MNIRSAMGISASGMSAERFRMDVIASNIANANSMRVDGKDPYRRRAVILRGGEDGVSIGRVEEDRASFRNVFEPGNPQADAQGNVQYSNVEPLREMVDMITAQRSYEANVAAYNSSRNMVRSALSIGRA
ncbi:MAG: flagellar basal body rod protein FlgC [Fimbriimonadaceae bacterium]|nr:flagellar basal body rod protein FlgC [Fimbriimonadaceae bacterium]QYK54708.1 MAG: flagellar basal body rod protein FlgC [Fimbriimonadaceae bacterium]